MKTVYHGETTTIYGLSTDTKDTVGVANGTAFVEMDTGKVFLFDEENGQWQEL